MVDIVFGSSKLERLCNEDKVARKDLGPDCARKLRARLDDLSDAADLGVMRTLPGRCHELKGDLDGCLAIDLQGGHRLVIEPADKPVPRKTDGGLDWNRVTCVRVVAVEDYHD